MKDNPSPMEQWLDHFPPKKNVIQEKKRGEKVKTPRSGLGHKGLEKLDAQIQLDIHGHTARAAEIEVNNFIDLCYKRGVRRALIIHGKGKHSQGEAVLKPLVSKILRDNPKVACSGDARKGEGGQGASWFSPVIVPGR